MKIVLILFLLALSGCAGFPPVTLGYTFPDTVTITAGGQTATVPVSTGSGVTAPVLLVPTTSTVSPSVVVQSTATSPQLTVKVIKAPVTAPVLAAP